MSESLFRPEALNARRQSVHGRVLVRYPVSTKSALAFVVAVTLAIILFILFGQTSRKETVQGSVVAASGVSKVRARAAGVVDSVMVKEGQSVAVGDVLVVISQPRLDLNRVDTEAELIRKTTEEIVSQEKKLKSIASIELSEKQRLLSQISQAKSDGEILASRSVLIKEKLNLARSRLSEMEGLSTKGFVSQSQVRDQRQLTIDTNVAATELAMQVNASQAHIAELEIQLKLLPVEQENRRTEIRSSINEQKQHLSEIQSRRGSTIVAQSAGIITSVQVKPGQSVSAQDLLMQIVPNSDRLEAELFVPTRAIGFIKLGQSVNIKYQAFPYQKYGMHKGTVVSVTKSIIMPNDVSSGVPLAQEPYYRVTVSLVASSIKAYNEEFPLQSGMLLDADILLGKQQIWELFFAPLISLKGGLV